MLDVIERRNKLKVYKEMLKDKEVCGRKEILKREERLKELNLGNLKREIESFKINLHNQNVLVEIEKEMEKIKRKGSTLGEAKVIYGNILKVGIKRGECPVCCTRIGDTGEFKDKIEKLISKVPEFNLGKLKGLERVYGLVKNFKEKEKVLNREKEEMERFREDIEQQENKLKGKIAILEKENFEVLLEELELSLLDYEEENVQYVKTNLLFTELETLEKETKDCVPVNTVGLEKELEVVRNKMNDKKKELEERIRKSKT